MLESTANSISTIESPIQNIFRNTSSSHVGDEYNNIVMGMDDFLWDNHAMEGMFLDALKQDQLGDDAHIFNTFFQILKSASTTPLFGHGSRSTQLGTPMLIYKLKVMHGMSDVCSQHY